MADRMADKKNSREVLQVTTSCPFPVAVYSTTVRYLAVRKASGIAYTLLELINSEVDRNEMTGNVLELFGIPADMHWIYADAMASLEEDGIVSCVYRTDQVRDVSMFSNMYMREFSFTPKGRQLFRDKYIPADKEKVKTPFISYYPAYPAQRRYVVGKDSKLQVYTSSSLSSDPDFLDRISGETARIEGDGGRLEEFIQSAPAKSAMDISAEEKIITPVETKLDPWCVVRTENNMTIHITEDGVTFSFTSKDEENFFTKYYTPEQVKSILLAKERYKFRGSAPAPAAYADIMPDKLYIPDDAVSIPSGLADIYIGTGAYATAGNAKAIKTGAAESEELLKLMNPHASFALLDKDAGRYCCVCSLVMPCTQFPGKTFEMQLLTENRMPAGMLEAVLDRMYDIYSQRDISGDSAGIIAYIADAKDGMGAGAGVSAGAGSGAVTAAGAGSGAGVSARTGAGAGTSAGASAGASAGESVLESYVTLKMSAADTADRKISILMDIRKQIAARLSPAGKAMWKTVFERHGRALYAQSAAEAGIDSLVRKYPVLNPLRAALNISDEQFISDLAQHISAENSAGNSGEEILTVYQAFENLGFKDTQILPVANAVEVLADMVLRNEDITSRAKTAISFNNLRAAMWALNDLLDINGFSGVIINTDYDVAVFTNAYKSFTGTYGAVRKKYMEYAPQAFRDMDEYAAIYKGQDDIHTAEAVGKDPDRITRQDVEGFIKKADNIKLSVSLQKKLEHDLKVLLGTDPASSEKLVELIRRANEAGYITYEERTVLDAFRDWRNSVIHRPGYTDADSAAKRSWADLVFSLADRKEDTPQDI